MSARFVIYALSTLVVGVSIAGVSGAAEKAAWPQSIIDRPLTLPEGSVSIGTGFGANADKDFSDASLSVGGLWGASYGVTNELSLGVAYDMLLQGDEAGKGTITLGGGYTYYAEGALILTGTANFGYDADASEMGNLALGSYVWFNAMPWMAIISPGDQITVGLAEPNDIGVSLPIGLGFQAAPALFIEIDTTIAEFQLNNDGTNTFFGADSTPLDLTFYISPTNEWDITVGGGVNANVGDGTLADTATLSAGVTYYGNVN